ncbi:MAG: thioredoxin domain-containing protein [Polyangiaceae bacterium]
MCGCASAGPIDREIDATGPGRITVVEFVDYGCTHCQELAERIDPVLEEFQGRVRVVIKQVPLEDKHPGATRLAAAAVCAEVQGRLEPVHAALIRGGGFSDDGLLDLAQHAGLDVEAFKACLRSDFPLARIKSDTSEWESLGADGLPMVFVDHEKFVGMVGAEPIEKALRDRAGDR